MAEIIVFLQSWGALIVAAASLLIAVISLVKSSKAQQLQNQVNRLELSIKQYELDKIDSEKAAASRSCVEARIIQISKNGWKLKVWNSGNITAYNIKATLEEGAEILLIDSKMPFEELEPNKSFEENLIVHMGSARKVRITTTWEDKDGEKHEKNQMVGL